MNVPTDWFQIDALPGGVLRISEPFVDPWFSANMYLVPGRDRDLLVDTGMGILPLRPILPSTTGKPILAVATHVHLDHVGGLHEFEDRAGPAAEAHYFVHMPDNATFAGEYRSLDKPVLRQPYPGWSVEAYAIKPAPLTRILSEGDEIDLGDRVFSVLELPGHSPGIGLFEHASGVFFAGDAIYDDQLLDGMPCSDKGAYRATMRRLLADVQPWVVYGGHGEPFDGDRMREIARDYLQSRGTTS